MTEEKFKKYITELEKKHPLLEKKYLINDYECHVFLQNPPFL